MLNSLLITGRVIIDKHYDNVSDKEERGKQFQIRNGYIFIFILYVFPCGLATLWAELFLNFLCGAVLFRLSIGIN